MHSANGKKIKLKKLKKREKKVRGACFFSCVSRAKLSHVKLGGGGPYLLPLLWALVRARLGREPDPHWRRIKQQRMALVPPSPPPKKRGARVLSSETRQVLFFWLRGEGAGGKKVLT